MDINNNYLIGSLNRVQSNEAKNNVVLNQEDFLKILAAEISNPSFSDDGGGGSGSKTDYMSSILQMNLLDQITELSTTMQNTMLMTQQQQALSLVGKQVTVAGKTDGLVKGQVETDRFSNGFASIRVGGIDYNLIDVIEVGESLGE